jgi:hypothetical protein
LFRVRLLLGVIFAHEKAIGMCDYFRSEEFAEVALPVIEVDFIFIVQIDDIVVEINEDLWKSLSKVLYLKTQFEFLALSE